jgi:hypothetical protein
MTAGEISFCFLASIYHIISLSSTRIVQTISNLSFYDSAINYHVFIVYGIIPLFRPCSQKFCDVFLLYAFMQFPVCSVTPGDSAWRVYVTSFYFCSYTLTSVGYGDLGPKNILERAFCTGPSEEQLFSVTIRRISKPHSHPQASKIHISKC